MLILRLVGILFGIEFILSGVSIWTGNNYGIVHYIYPKEYLEFYSINMMHVPFWFKFILGLCYIAVPIYFCFRLWIEDDCNILKWFKPSKKQLVYKYINIDLIKPDDHKWRNEIIQRAKNKENLVAYSKNGALEARSKAKILGIEKCFVDFKSKDEVEKDRGW